MDYILSIDPGTSTGYCLTKIDRGTSSANIYEYGYLIVKTTSDYQGDHCIDLMNKVQTIIDREKVALRPITSIVIEDYYFSKRFANGSVVNVAFRTAIHILARKNDIKYTIVNVSAWKSFVAGRASPTKDQRKKWGTIAAKKIYIQEALWINYGFKFPNHCLSKITHKPIAFKYDIVDVIGQTVYYCCLLNRLQKITLSVECPKDVKFTKPPKKQFSYGPTFLSAKKSL